jgi:hypothetical protein
MSCAAGNAQAVCLTAGCLLQLGWKAAGVSKRFLPQSRAFSVQLTHGHTGGGYSGGGGGYHSHSGGGGGGSYISGFDGNGVEGFNGMQHGESQPHVRLAQWAATRLPFPFP